MNFQKWELFSGSPGTLQISTIQLQDTSGTRDHEEQNRMTTRWPSTFNNKRQDASRTSHKKNEKIITCKLNIIIMIINQQVCFMLYLVPNEFHQNLEFRTFSNFLP